MMLSAYKAEEDTSRGHLLILPQHLKKLIAAPSSKLGETENFSRRDRCSTWYATNGTNSRHPELQPQQQQQQPPPHHQYIIGTLGARYNGILVHRLMVTAPFETYSRIWVYRAGWMQIGSSLDNFRKLQYYYPQCPVLLPPMYSFVSTMYSSKVLSAASVAAQ
jgi:hypothetical protein